MISFNKNNKEEFLKYFKNTFWGLFNRVLLLVISFTTSILVARHLEPNKFGQLSYVISIVAILRPIVDFGLVGVLVKELVQNQKDNFKILGSVFLFKSLLSLVIFAFCFLYATSQIPDPSERNLFLIVVFSLLLHPIYSLEYWFEAKVKIGNTTLMKTIFLIISASVKIYFIYFEYGLWYFGLAYSIEVLLICLALVISYLRSDGVFLNWNFDKNILFGLLSKSWLLFLSGISVIIYFKVDQVMLKNMVSATELGYYTAAIKFSEAWYFIPQIIMASLFPALIKAKSNQVEFNKRFQQLSDMLFGVALFIALGIMLLSTQIIQLTYGEAYLNSIDILSVHIWSVIFIFFSAILSRWLIVEELYKYSLINQVSGAILNVFLNYVLIPQYGGLGAAYATLISYSFSSIIIIAFIPKTRNIALIFAKSIVLPIRLMYKVSSKS